MRKISNVVQKYIKSEKRGYICAKILFQTLKIVLLCDELLLSFLLHCASWVLCR